MNKIYHCFFILFLLCPGKLVFAQSYYAMSGGNYSEPFTDLDSWTNNYANASLGSQYWGQAQTAINSTVNTNTVFSSGNTGGVQKLTGSMILLATGVNFGATDLYIDFTGRNAGTLSFNWEKIINSVSATPKSGALKIQYSSTGANGTFSDLTATGLPISFDNGSTAQSGTLTAIPIPASLNNSQVIFRFYFGTSDNTGLGNRPKVSIDNLSITSTVSISITTSAPTPSSPFCITTSTGASISVPFTSTGSFSSNTYTAQLSDASGGFGSPVAIGSLVSDLNSGSIPATIPANTTSGTGYRIRVVSGNPSLTGTDNGSDLTINLAAAGILTGNTVVCSGSVQNYSVTTVPGTTSYTWTLPGGWTGSSTTNTITATAGASGDIIVKANNACGNNPQQILTVTTNPSPAVPVATAATFTGNTLFKANWNTVAGATGYYVDVYTPAVNVTAAAWNFPTNGSIVTASSYSPNNNGKTISTNASVITDATGATTQSASATAWNGGFDSKYWQVDVNTIGFTNLRLSSKQRSSGTGPKDFKVQYRIGAGAWVDIVSASITVADNFTSGVLNNLVLPVACEGQPAVSLRWIMTSNVSVSAGTVGALGSSRVDDISITGDNFTFIPGFENVYTTDHSLDVTGLNPSTAYYYVVRAANTNCNSINSNEITVTTTATCTPTAVITSFTPATGPVGTRVTVTGSGFTGATSVRFGAANATSFSILNSNTIIAQVPAGAAFDYIKVVMGACASTSSAKFTVLTNNGTCGKSTGPVLSEPFISEVYNASTGSLSYIEIFNPTAANIDLSSYALQLQTSGGVGNTITDYPLSGVLAIGATRVLRIGTSTPTCSSPAPSWSFPAGTGMNGNDQVFLLKAGIAIDRVDNINYGGGAQPGSSQLRKPASPGPSLVYNVNDWTATVTEDCGHLGIPPFNAASPSVTINTHPSDILCANQIVLSVAALSSSGNYSYTWYYNNPSTTNGWLASSSLGTRYSITGGTTNTITISANTHELLNYQFYVVVGSVGTGQCVQYSQAVQYSPGSKSFYRSIANDSWNAANTWEMSDALAGPWGATCTYPVAANSNEVIIDHTVTLPVEIAIDKVTINTVGTLEISNTGRLMILNGGASADFTVLGTLYDRGGNGNGIDFEDNTGTANDATWLLGANGNIIKTGLSSVTNYRDFYETGIANIPASANWTFRYEGTNMTFASSVGGTAMYYPNLTMENSITGNTYASVINAGNPTLSSFTLTGANNPVIIKGHFNVGGSGPGNISFRNINNHSPVSILGNLEVRAGSTLSIDGGTPNIGTGFNVAGNVTVAGTLNVAAAGSGLLRFSGSGGTQTISGAGNLNLQDVTIANTGSIISLEKNIATPGVLTFSAGSRLDLTSGDITIRSVAGATGRVAPFGAGVAINYGSGRFVVERYYPADRSWRLVTSPLSNTGNIFASWQNNGIYTPGRGVFVTGPNPDIPVNGLDDSQLDNASLKTFANNAYLNVGNTLSELLSGNSTAAANKGYFMFVRGDRSRLPDNTVLPNTNVTTLSSRGFLQTGTQTFTLSNSSGAAALFSIVGNPFASSVDFNLLTKTNLNTRRFYAWDPHINQVGAFVTMEDYATPGTFVSTTLPTTQGNFIQSSQAIFVQMLGPTGSIAFKEADKSDNYNGALFRPFTTTGNDAGRIHTKLLIMHSENNGTLADANLAEFNNAYDNAVDMDDALKMTNIHENLGYRRNNRILAVERRGEIIANDTLFFYLNKLSVKNYRLQLESANMSPLLTAVLEDKFTGHATPLNLTGSSLYNFKVNALPASYSPDRFRIVFKTAGTVPVSFTSINAAAHGKNITVEWTVENESGIKSYEVEKSVDGVNFHQVSTITARQQNSTTTYDWIDQNTTGGFNYYRVRSIDAHGSILYSNIVKVIMTALHPAFSVYPNPVMEGNIDLLFTNQPAGIYQVRLYNGMAQMILDYRVEHIGGTAVKSIRLKNLLSKGLYQLEIIHPDKTKNIVKVIR